ncbi:hypothetical protein AURDEDRAFT_110293 [Auricularia subglabra TFB-10046 SS5]|nr:hypothetical protein AURDEDRAFT_110293 [Auricularia subglabra TFB-10046 SS5]
MPESVGHRLFAPPPGPPPPPQAYYAAPPPPGPPPGYDELAAQYPAQGYGPPPPPPPPVLSYNVSPALNASEDECEAGDQFIRENPIAPPRPLQPHEINAIDSGQIHLLPPAHFRGGTTRGVDGTTLLQSRPGCPDTTLVSHVPLYSAWRQSPNTIYYEVQILSLGRDSSVAIGFAAVPYPPFRLPGWHRGSIGVHADDGHRYACDADGGVPLTEPFQRGDVVGLGLELRTAQVWFTRNGALAGGWNLREGREPDAEVWGNEWEGLDGASDVYAAVGVCGSASAIVNVGGARAGSPWSWTPAA